MADTTDEPDLDNPAARLHELLGNLRSHPEQDAAVGLPLGQYLGADYPNEMAPLLRSLADVYALPDQIRYEVKFLPIPDTTVLLKRLSEVETAFGRMTLNQNLRQFNDQISDAAMDNLDTCASMLRQLGTFAVVDESTLSKIRDQVAALLEEVLADSDALGTALFEQLIGHLYEMLRAIDTYKVTGAGPIVRSAERAVGAIVVDIVNGGDKLARHSLGKKLGIVAAGVLMTLNIVTETVALTQALAPDALPRATATQSHEASATDD
jgi:hypothetical protein